MYEEIAFWSMVAALVLALCLPAIRIHARRKHNIEWLTEIGILKK